MFEQYLDLYDVKEIRSRSLVYFGCGAIARIDTIADALLRRGIDRLLIVTGRNAYRASGAWGPVEKALRARRIAFVHFDRITPNPETGAVDEAVRLGREFGAGAVLGIGGGSAIDAAKSAAVLLDYPDQDARALYEWRFTPETARPIIAINLTHGTGSEANRVAVVSILDRQYKPAIACDCIYPTWSIDDPELMRTLSADQIRYTSIDAVNHVIEAATTRCTNPLAITLARETVALVARYLPEALADPSDLNARYHLTYAALLGGISFDNGFLHYTHALEHPLSAVRPELTHGLGLAMLVPAVLKQIYPDCAPVLADILAPAVPGLRGEPDEALRAAAGLERWLGSVGATAKLADAGFRESDIPRLVELTFATPSLPALLAAAPVEATANSVAAIYRDSLRPLGK